MTIGSPDSITANDDRNALRDAIGWLSVTGGLMVFDKKGEVHVYRGQIHTTVTWDRNSKAPVEAGAEAALTAIRQAKEAYGS